MTADQHALAPLSRRGVAWLIDAALGLVLAGGFVKLVAGEQDLKSVWGLVAFKSVNGKAGHQLSAVMSPAGMNLATLRPVIGLLAIIGLLAAIAVAYRVVTTAKWGAGVGKALLGLRVVAVDPETQIATAPGWGRSWKRWLVPQAPGLIPLPGTSLLAYLPAARDAQRRGLHDRAAGTIVITTRCPPAAPAPAPWRLAALDGYAEELPA